ncbi:MAG: hypothetical protein IKS05_00590 [Oscillospiraceae bacterium]|nr:hypothetical protein [Oscillospiraceae bacterium]
MRENAYFSCVLVLLALCLVLSGCKASSSSRDASGAAGEAQHSADPEASGQTSAEPSAQGDPMAPVFDLNCLGEPVDVDFSDENWEQKLTDNGGVYQVVYRFAPNRPLTPLRALRYTSFLSITNNPTDSSAYAKSESGYQANVRIRDIMSESVAFGPSYAPVGDLSAIALLEAYVLPLEYVPTEETWDVRDWVANFIVEGPKNSGEYVIDRDGTVYRNGREVAVRPVPEEITDYLYAVSWAYAMSNLEQFSFNSGPFENEKCLQVCTNEKEVYLFDDEANALVELLSDLEEGAFSCRPRFNCGPEDHGKALFSLNTGTYRPESGFSASGGARHFTLWEDGHLTFTRPAIVSYGFSPDHELLCDWLNLSCPYVSAAAFDVDTISAFLAQKLG